MSHTVAQFSLSILWKTNFISNFYDSNNKSEKIDGKDSSLLLKPSEQVKHLVNQFNMSSPPDDINSDETGNAASSKYYDIDELQI